MGKHKQIKKAQKLKHEALGNELIQDSLKQEGHLKEPKSQAYVSSALSMLQEDVNNDIEDNDIEDYNNTKDPLDNSLNNTERLVSSDKIQHLQSLLLSDEHNNNNDNIEHKTKTLPNIDYSFDEPIDGYEEEEEEDIDNDIALEDMSEEEKALFLLNNNPNAVQQRQSLASLILKKIHERNEKESSKEMESNSALLDSRVVEVYTQVGQLLSKYTSGKIPKSFKIIPMLQNWQQILELTKPDSWTPNATYEATKLFAKGSPSNIAQQFYSDFLLEIVRDDITEHKKLNFHLFQALKIAIFKPKAFVKGILIPLAESMCTGHEAAIISAVLMRISIPVLHAGVALLKLLTIPWSAQISLFIKTLLSKKYSLHRSVIDSLVSYFAAFSSYDSNITLPIIWHLTLLTFVQRYKQSLSQPQKDILSSLIRKKPHYKISPEIRKEISK